MRRGPGPRAAGGVDTDTGAGDGGAAAGAAGDGEPEGEDRRGTVAGEAEGGADGRHTDAGHLVVDQVFQRRGDCRKAGALLHRVDIRRAVEGQHPALARKRSAGEGHGRGAEWRDHIGVEGRPADADGVTGDDRLEFAVEVAIDAVAQALCHAIGGDAYEVVDRGRRDGVGDARVMGTLGGAVIDRHDLELARGEPVAVVEGETAGAGAGDRSRVGELHTGVVEQADLAIEAQVDAHQAGGRLGQHHPVVVEQQGARRVGAFGHDRRRLRERARIVVGGDQHRRGVVVDHHHRHPQHGQAVIGAAILRAGALLHPVHDVEGVVAFGERVLWREHIDRLRDIPVAAGEQQRHAIDARGAGGGRGIGRQRDSLAAGSFHAFAQRHRRCRDQHVLFRRPAQHHLVAVDHQNAAGALEYPQRPLVLRDHHRRAVIVGDVDDDVAHEDRLVGRVVAGDGVDHQAAMALELVADHRDFATVAAADVEIVAAQAADDFQRHASAGALDEEAVVALKRVDHDAL